MNNAIYTLLLEKAEEQLSRLTSKVTDETWFDSLLVKLKDGVLGAGLDDTTLEASLEAISLIEKNKSTLVGLGTNAFTLLLFQITSGRDEEAIKTYIGALTNADDLIALMNAGSDGVIRAKMELDRLNSQAKKMALDFATAGIRFLIPFLIGLI